MMGICCLNRTFFWRGCAAMLNCYNCSPRLLALRCVELLRACLLYKCLGHQRLNMSRWWFLRFSIFIPTWEMIPIWLILCNWVETTNYVFHLEKVASCVHHFELCVLVTWDFYVRAEAFAIWSCQKNRKRKLWEECNTSCLLSGRKPENRNVPWYCLAYSYNFL